MKVKKNIKPQDATSGASTFMDNLKSFLVSPKFKRIAEKLLLWTIFSVGIALLPILFKMIRPFLRGEEIDFWTAISYGVSNGELFLVATALVATALSEMVLNNTDSLRFLKILLSGGCIILFGLAAFCFADISAIGENADSQVIDNPSQDIPTPHPRGSEATEIDTSLSKTNFSSLGNIPRISIFLFTLSFLSSGFCAALAEL